MLIAEVLNVLGAVQGGDVVPSEPFTYAELLILPASHIAITCQLYVVPAANPLKLISKLPEVEIKFAATPEDKDVTAVTVLLAISNVSQALFVDSLNANLYPNTPEADVHLNVNEEEVV